jgi:hypothetical protein
VISDSVPAQTPEPEPTGGEPSITSGARPRWLIPGAAAVVVLAVAIGLVAGMTLTNRTGAGSGAASYVPADTAAYYELRLDLPGDQRPALRSFLSHFPLLQVDKYLTDEIDQQLDQLSSAAPSGYRYSTDVKPWFDGRLGLALVRYPTIIPNATSAVPDVLVLVGVKDATAAGTLSDRVRADLTKAGATITSTSHSGVTIWSAKMSSGTTGTTPGTPQEFAWAITADELIGAPSVELVGQALDSHSGAAPSLAARDEFSAGVARLPADRVFTLSIDLKTVLAQLQKDLASSQVGGSAASILPQIAAQAPTYEVMGARFENDRFVMDSSATMSQAEPANTDRGLAAMTPADAIFFSDAGNVGPKLASYVGYLKSVIGASGATGSPSLDQLESALGGDLGSFVSWMGDTALVAGDTDNTPWVGLISKPTDAQAARSKLQQLQTLLQLASTNGGPRVDISTADHGGTSITTIQFEDSSGSTPVWASSLQYAVTDQRVVIGTGASFVGRVLDMQSSSSLAGNTRFSSALSSVGGTPNIGDVWLDLTALRTALEPLVPADSKTVYETSVKPWVAPFDYLVSAGKSDGQRVDSRIAIVVK